jgi:hypothetical protein
MNIIAPTVIEFERTFNDQQSVQNKGGGGEREKRKRREREREREPSPSTAAASSTLFRPAPGTQCNIVYEKCVDERRTRTILSLEEADLIIYLIRGAKSCGGNKKENKLF